jgi:hypothetical protein
VINSPSRSSIAGPATTAKPPAERKCAEDHIARHDIANRNSEPGWAGKIREKFSIGIAAKRRG